MCMKMKYKQLQITSNEIIKMKNAHLSKKTNQVKRKFYQW